MKRQLSNLFSFDERMVILDSYVNDSLSYIVAKQITDRVCDDRLCFHSTDVSASCRIRNGCTVMFEIPLQFINRKIWRELKWKNINTGVFILRTLDYSVILTRFQVLYFGAFCIHCTVKHVLFVRTLSRKFARP